MKPESKDIVGRLNNLLVIELTASDAYWVQWQQLREMGYGELAEARKADAAEELEHAGKLVKRIIELEGTPAMARATVATEWDVQGMLEAGLKIEEEARTAYAQAITEMLNSPDQVTADLLNDNQRANEDGVLWHERQLRLIEQMGLQNYLAEQAG